MSESSIFKGKFIAIEGTDGSGKATQADYIKLAVDKEGVPTDVIAFPRYDTPSGRMVRRYLNNDFGPASKLNQELSAYFYIVDRYAASRDINKALSLGHFVVADRFTGSNLAHQGAKLTDKKTRRKFYESTIEAEFKEWQIPRPEKNFVLFVSRAISRQRQLERVHNKSGLDGHEADQDYQERVSLAYEELCEMYPDWFIPVDCMRGNEQLNPHEVNLKLLKSIRSELSG